MCGKDCDPHQSAMCMVMLMQKLNIQKGEGGGGKKLKNVIFCLISFHHMDKTGDFTTVLLHQHHIAKLQSNFCILLL